MLHQDRIDTHDEIDDEHKSYIPAKHRQQGRRKADARPKDKSDLVDAFDSIGFHKKVLEEIRIADEGARQLMKPIPKNRPKIICEKCGTVDTRRYTKRGQYYCYTCDLLFDLEDGG